MRTGTYEQTVLDREKGLREESDEKALHLLEQSPSGLYRTDSNLARLCSRHDTVEISKLELDITHSQSGSISSHLLFHHLF
jgi:hypothetical protein